MSATASPPRLPETSPPTPPTRAARAWSAQEAGLVALLAAEVVVFGLLGTRFLTVENGFETLRLSVEIGLLALALTPVIVGGGIDLSVGSLMGLSAVIFGKLWRDLGLPIGLAIPPTLLIAALAGGLNALLITRGRIPPLIVTLGTYSLFRGLAEGLARAVDNFTNFPPGFLYLGQGYLLGVIPAQVPILIATALGFWFLLQRSTIGRAIYAIGFAPEGAKYAGIPVERRVGLTYILSGLTSGLAAIVYVAHLGQAKADAGTGYELMAITAVVLGGTSIFGGRGTIAGTLLGLMAIAVLQRGMRLADLPAEWSGILTGVLLLAAILLDRLPRRRAVPLPVNETATTASTEEFDVKNAQVAAICLAVLGAAGIIAASNWNLARSFRDELARRDGGAPTASAGLPGPAQAPITVAMMPKSKGNAYFIACRKGAEEAAKDLGVTLIWDGPTDPDPAKQTEVIETWITRGVDVIAVAVENRDGIVSVLKKARDRGIKVVTWDADCGAEGRDFFVNQATPEAIGDALMDHAARILGGKGEFAIITASLTAANMIAWQETIEARRASKYPEIAMATIRPCDDLQKKAFDEANTILNTFPGVKVIMGICTPAVPGAAEAVKQAGRKDVKVIGLGLPNDNKPYVHEGITDAVVLWKTADLGYLAVLASKAVKEGTLKPGDASMDAGRLGKVEIAGDNILLGTPFTFTTDNIDGFDF